MRDHHEVEQGIGEFIVAQSVSWTPVVVDVRIFRFGLVSFIGGNFIFMLVGELLRTRLRREGIETEEKAAGWLKTPLPRRSAKAFVLPSTTRSLGGTDSSKSENSPSLIHIFQGR